MTSEKAVSNYYVMNNLVIKILLLLFPLLLLWCLWNGVVGEEKEEIARCFLHADHSL